jgi:hypothetical protein
VLENQFTNTRGAAGNLLANLTVDIKQLMNVSGDGIPSPSREVPHKASCKNQLADISAEILGPNMVTEETVELIGTAGAGETIGQTSDKPSDEEDHLWLLNPAAGNGSTYHGAEQPEVPKTFEPTLLTRKSDLTTQHGWRQFLLKSQWATTLHQLNASPYKH